MPEERLDLVKKMLKQSPNDTFLNYAAALEFQKIGDKAKAIELFEKVIALDKNYLGAYYQLGKMHENEGTLPKAIATYKTGKEIAKKLNDQKAIGELTEALMLLDEEEGNW